MNIKSFWEKFLYTFSLLAMFFFLAGTKACQEDYFLASQSTALTPTATPTPTDDGSDDDDDPDDDDDLITATPTAQATGTEEPDETAVPEPTATIGATGAAQDILTELALLDRGEEDDTDDESAERSANPGSLTNDTGTTNWLGRAFSGDDDQNRDRKFFRDTDGDGFADWLEEEHGSDPRNPNSQPIQALKTSLISRMSGIDNDMDGLPNASESKYGTNPGIADSDGDGFMDGIEILAMTDPMNPKDRPSADEDGDGAPDELENERGTSLSKADTDGDGLSDVMEFVLGTNPLAPDTDGDGISDGKEFDLGTDPLIPDR